MKKSSFIMSSLFLLFFLSLCSLLSLQVNANDALRGGVFIAQPKQAVLIGPDSAVKEVFENINPTAIVSAQNSKVWVVEKEMHRVRQYTFSASLIHEFQFLQFRYPLVIAPTPEGGAWVAYEKYVLLLDKDLQEEARVYSFLLPRDIAITSKGSAWVADTGNRRLVKLNAKGQELISFRQTTILAMDYDLKNENLWVIYDDQDTIAKLSVDGSEILSVKYFSNPSDISVCQNDGSVWVANTDQNELVHVGFSGEILKRIKNLQLPKLVDTFTTKQGKCNVWFTDKSNNELVLIDEKGNEKERLTNHRNIIGISAIEGSTPVKPSFKTTQQITPEGETIKLTQEGVEIMEDTTTANLVLQGKSKENLPSDAQEAKAKENNTIEKNQNLSANNQQLKNEETFQNTNKSNISEKQKVFAIYLIVILLFGVFLIMLFVWKGKK